MSDSISGNELSQNGNGAIVDFQTDFLSRQGINSTSLCDRYNIHMFTQEFELMQNQVKESELKSREANFSKVYANMDQTSFEQTFTMVMNTDMDMIIKKEYTDDMQSNAQIGFFAYALLGAVLAGTVFFVIEKARRRKRENNTNNNQSSYKS